MMILTCETFRYEGSMSSSRPLTGKRGTVRGSDLALDGGRDFARVCRGERVRVERGRGRYFKSAKQHLHMAQF